MARIDPDCGQAEKWGKIASMESVTRNVADIEGADRRALEHLIGKHLTEHQQVIISIVNLDLPGSDAPVAERPVQTLEDWDIYKGLSEEEIEAIDRVVKTRANLTRNVP